VRRNLGIVAALAALAGCTGAPTGPVDAAPPDAGEPDAPPESARAIFQLPRPGVAETDFYDLPFPNDLRRRDDGTIDLAAHPRPNPLVGRYLDTFEVKVDGFGTNAAAFFRFSGRIDPRTLPDTPDEARQQDASVYLVDVDPDSPERGERVPLRFRFEHYAGEFIGTNWLSVLIYPGFPLRPSTTYAAVVTRRVRATDGTDVTRDPDMDEVLAGGAGDDTVLKARMLYEPLLTWLDAPGGDERADVVSAAVFTTQDPTWLMGRLRDIVYRDAPEPQARQIRFGGDYDDFLLYEGVYDGPNFQSGEPPYLEGGGEILFDDAGDPIIQRMEPIRFAVSIPKQGEMPQAGWPVVLYAHGTGGSFRSFVHDHTAARMAAQGLAVLSIDQVLHGPRNQNGGNVELAFFNFDNPVAARDNVRQGALDDFQLVRLARNLTIAPRHPGAKRYELDGDRLYFMGHSQGGLTGPPFLAYEPLIQGAVLSGAGGLIYYSLINKTEPVDITVIIGSFIRDVPLDEFNPMLAMVQMFIEAADPANYARLLVREPVPGVGAKDIFQSEGFIDHYTPPPDIEALGVAIGASPVSPILQPVEGFTLRGLQALDPPVTDNLGGRTAVFLQYNEVPDSDGHFVVFDVPAAQKQHAEFLGTLAREGRATLVAP
jgi:predicted esterase